MFKHHQILWNGICRNGLYWFYKYGSCYDEEFDSWLPVCSAQQYRG